MAFFDERFNSSTFFYGLNANDYLVEKSLALKPQSKILSLGEGEGRNALFLAKRGHSIVAVDESLVGLNKARDLLKKNQLELEIFHGDISNYPFLENSFDAIISIWFHLPKELRKSIHQKCVKALKPNGILILEAYTPKQLENSSGGPKNLDMLMSKAELENEFKGLRFIELQELNREIHEGEGHNGPSAVVQLLGQKL
jgi:SAM-dependent methyltransferase